MKKKFLLMTALFLIGILALSDAQSVRLNSAKTKAEPARLSDAAVDSLLAVAAEQAVEQFSSQLQASLQVALKEGGPLNAVNICNVVAPDIQIAHFRGGWFIERVTAKPRNHNNQADSAQLAILALFESDSGAPGYIAHWVDPKKREKFQFFRPIKVKEVCLGCHGDTAGFVPGLTAEINKYYREDKATGYKVDELRGMFAVEILWPEGRAYAEKLAGSVKQDSK